MPLTRVRFTPNNDEPYVCRNIFGEEILREDIPVTHLSTTHTDFVLGNDGSMNPVLGGTAPLQIKRLPATQIGRDILAAADAAAVRSVIGVTAAPSPQYVYYVSPSFSAASPYFPTIQGAIDAIPANTHGLVIVHEGTYTENLTIDDKTHIHCYAGVTLKPASNSGNGLFNVSAEFTLTGHAVLDFSSANYNTKYMNITAGRVILEFDRMIGNASYGSSADTYTAIDVTGGSEIIIRANKTFGLKLTAPSCNYIVNIGEVEGRLIVGGTAAGDDNSTGDIRIGLMRGDAILQRGTYRYEILRWIKTTTFTTAVHPHLYCSQGDHVIRNCEMTHDSTSTTLKPLIEFGKSGSYTGGTLTLVGCNIVHKLQEYNAYAVYFSTTDSSAVLRTKDTRIESNACSVIFKNYGTCYLKDTVLVTLSSYGGAYTMSGVTCQGANAAKVYAVDLAISLAGATGGTYGFERTSASYTYTIYLYSGCFTTHANGAGFTVNGQGYVHTNTNAADWGY